MCKSTKIKLVASILTLTLLIAFCGTLPVLAANQVKGLIENSNDFMKLSESEKKIMLSENGKVNFKVVTAQDAPDEVKTTVQSLIETIRSNSNNGAVLTGVSAPGSDNYDSSTMEILIGDTGYNESNKVFSETGYGGWCVTFEGNKLVVAAYSRDCLVSAISRLVSVIRANASNGSISLAADMKFADDNDTMINNLPLYEWDSLPKTVYESTGTSLATIFNTNKENYYMYLSKLEALGYTYHTGNAINNNLFATYYNNEFVINASFIPYESAVRITIEKNQGLVGLKSQNTYTANPSVTTSVAQIGLSVAPSYPNNGMSYVMQLADGSFIIIDGGFTGDADRLYKYLKAKAPNGEIVIAAWFLTHNDGDHRQCFVQFVLTYDNVKIEMLVYNFPSSGLYADSGGGEHKGSESAAIGLAQGGTKVIKAHTGYKFFIRNAEIEILYSLDNLLPNPLKIFNNSSLVLSMKLEGQRTIFMGDASDDPAKILSSMYGTSLKCDVLQIAHHGLRNGHGTNMPNTLKLYELMRPEIVLWPLSESHYLNVNNEAIAYQVANFNWNKAASDGAREVYIAGGDYAVIFELPYSMFTAYKWMFSDNSEN